MSSAVDRVTCSASLECPCFVAILVISVGHGQADKRIPCNASISCNAPHPHATGEISSGTQSDACLSDGDDGLNILPECTAKVHLSVQFFPVNCSSGHVLSVEVMLK